MSRQNYFHAKLRSLVIAKPVMQLFKRDFENNRNINCHIFQQLGLQDHWTSIVVTSGCRIITKILCLVAEMQIQLN